MSSVRYASGRTLASAPLITTEYPPTLDASALRGAWVIAPDGTMAYSDGAEWYANLPQGSEVLIPPWVAVPDGWFEVDIALSGVLGNRKLISNKFNVSYVLNDAETWPIVTSSAMYTDSAGTTPVLTAPEPVGLLEDSTTPHLNWYQDVTVDRPTWIEVTRTVAGEEKTVDAISFDGLGQQLKVDFPETVTGSMVHATSNGIYILGVEIPAGTYEFGRYNIWDIEEIILLDRFLTSGEATELIAELGKQRDRVTEPNFGTDWTYAFRDRTEIRSMPSFDFAGVTDMESAFRNSAAEEWLNGSFFDTAVDVTDFFRAFLFNNLTSIPAGLFDNTPNVTSFRGTFRDNDLTSIPAGLFDNTPNVTNFNETFLSNNLTSIPAGLFDNTPNVTTFRDTFKSNNLTSIPAGLFDNTPNVTDFGATFVSNNLTSIPAGLFDNTPNVTSFVAVFRENNLTSIPAGLFDNTPNVTTFYRTFQFNNLTSIPDGLFDNTPNVTNFDRTFRDNNLTSIPVGLFDNTPNVTNFGLTFFSNNLTSIPVGLFDNTPNVTNFSNTFRENDLTSIPDGLFDNTPNVTSFDRVFQSNNLTSIPAGLFNNTVNVTSFKEIFQFNNLTTAPANLFDTQTACTDYEEAFLDNDLDQTGVDNILVSVLASANANNLDNGNLGIQGGTNATPSATGQSAADDLRARGWTVNLNGY